MKKKEWMFRAAAILLVLAVVFLIARRVIPVELADLMPEDFCPEHCYVVYYEWNDNAELTGGEMQTLWALLNGLEYRYDGSIWNGVMKGELYHLTLTQREPPKQVNLFITKKRGIVYLDGREYEMLGDTSLLLDLLEQLK